jgi:GMP synthase (glutamine-hydrolysing)
MDIPKIYVVNYGSQYTMLLMRRLRSSEGGGVLCEMIHPDELSKVTPKTCRGVILSGGPQTVDISKITEDERRVVMDPQIPCLGVCYGMQLIGAILGGNVVHNQSQAEYDKNFLFFFGDSVSASADPYVF